MGFRSFWFGLGNWDKEPTGRHQLFDCGVDSTFLCPKENNSTIVSYSLSFGDICIA